MIRVYDLDINLLAEIDDYESLIFTRDYYMHGEFELTINANKNNVDTLLKDNLIVVDRAPNKCGIIKTVDREAEENESITILGYTLDYLFTDRIILPAAASIYDSITGPAETAIKHYIDNSVTDPTDADRKIDLFSLVADAGQGGSSEYNARYNELQEFLSAIRREQEIGIECRINLTTKKIDVDVIVGQDHTSGTANPVIFSTDYDNLISQRFFDSDVGYKNYAYTGGEGEGTTRDLAEVGSATGIDRREIFVDTNLPLASLPAAGATELASYPQIVTFEGEVINRLPFIYETDFDLGDEVTITNKRWGVDLNTRIIAITEIYEPDGFELDIAFGNEIPNLRTTINKKTKKEER